MEKTYCPFCGKSLLKRKIEGFERLFCSCCNVPIYENPVPATAAVITDKQERLLLVRRAVDPEKGKWCLPGGFVEIDESPEECIVRELKEETSLNGEVDRLIGIEMSHNVEYKSVMVAGFIVKNLTGVPRPGDDAVDIDYFPLGQLPEIAFASHLRLIEKVFHLKGNCPFNRFGAYVITSGNAIHLAEEACRAGARIIQYRDKASGMKKKIVTAKKIREITRVSQTYFLVNDNIDLALISEADGAHLGQEDIPIEEVRRMVSRPFIVGISTHSVEQAQKAMISGADYIGIGPVFPTPTKRDNIPIGLNVVRQVIAIANIPVVAIGGIDLQNIYQLQSIGVQNVAMVRGFQHNTYETVRSINRTLLAGQRN